ncbi:MAG: hypothetical protein C6I01_06925 [Epsilonproteobacteria bacterium]|nr:hypothetical protein [Campylobacterota bacterium]NPA89169.1 hypothetical protein [Campylobacterota bacterium]
MMGIGRFRRLQQLKRFKEGVQEEGWVKLIPKKFRKYLKKYDYNVDEVIGVKDKERYILHADRKIIRIYRGSTLKGEPLLCSYLPLEKAIFYSFELDKGAVERTSSPDELMSMIETEIYANAGIDETEEYIIKYKLVKNLKNEKKVGVEAVIIPSTFVEFEYADIIQETGYLDYLSFPAFSFGALYNDILEPATDAFVVLLEDKTFIAFYDGKELLTIKTLSEGLNDVWEELNELNIANFNKSTFIRLLHQKGLIEGRYRGGEKIVFERLKRVFDKLITIIENTIADIPNVFNIQDIERIFITSQYGGIAGIEEYMSKQFSTISDVNSFEFAKKYNLDQLPIEPFLFLAMLETHYAYKTGKLDYNFTLHPRKPTLFFRPSGQLLGATIATTILLTIPAVILWGIGFFYNFRSNQVYETKTKLSSQKLSLQGELKREEGILKTIEEKIAKLKGDIKLNRDLINSLYKFKYKDIPVSQNLTDIAYYMNRNNVYLKKIQMENGEYNVSVYTHSRFNIPRLLQQLKDAGFNVFTPEIVKEKGVYTATLMITDENTPLQFEKPLNENKKGKK